MQDHGIKEVIEEDIWGGMKDVLNFQLLNTGSETNPIVITVGLILALIFSLFAASAILKGFRILVTRKMAAEDRLKFISIFKFVRYFIYMIIFLLVLSAAGINIVVLLTASAALFVGLGLALREIFQDLIGGISIIIDKSLHVGDVVEVDGRVGRVIEISLRTTRALTRDDKIVIIPNHKFISDMVFNYTQNHKNTREVVNLGVAYGSDIGLVKKILLECAAAQKGILKTPEPFVLLEDFGDSALKFGIYFFINDSFVDPKIKSELRFQIEEEFRLHQVRIPFPQRDVHYSGRPNNLNKTDENG